MAWIQYRWECPYHNCGYPNTDHAGYEPDAITAQCRQCKKRVHIDITPRVTVEKIDTEDLEDD